MFMTIVEVSTMIDLDYLILCFHESRLPRRLSVNEYVTKAKNI